ncbi:uncharacterized protein LOC142349112 [Convolutriloba macropyga]|uniref:uncharacterized protein LOC142349112 n=1 Tax=Convolutriloba macropyga TaxID=536237 RepID=UPI003F526680
MSYLADPRYPRAKFTPRAKKRFGSESNLLRNSVSSDVASRGLYSSAAYSNENLLKSSDVNLQSEAVTSQRNLEARSRDLLLKVEQQLTRESATRAVFISVLDTLSMIKQNEERVIRRLASQLESNPGDLQHKIGRQLKSSERRMKKVEYHIMRLEQLEEQYKLKAQMRLGAQKAIESLKNSSGSTSKVAKREAADQVAVLTLEMCEIESRVENEFLGRWSITIDSLVGCTLLMPGDDYKVKFAFGGQKWKTKCRVRKKPSSSGYPGYATMSSSSSTSSSSGSMQEWTTTTGVFYPVIGGRFTITVKSVRGMLKLQTDVGQTFMYTDNMYSHENVTETIDITRSGALKLRFSIQWCWCVEGEEDYVPPVSSSVLEQPLHITHTNYNIPPHDEDTGSLSQSGSYHSGSLGTGSDLPRLDSPCRGGSVSAFAYRGTSFSTGGHDSFRSEHSNEGLPANRLTVALHNVALCVDQIYGYFAQLHNFEKQVRRLVQTLFPENERFSNIHFTSPEYLRLKSTSHSTHDDCSSTSSGTTDSSRKFSSSVSGNRSIDLLLLTHLYLCLPQFKEIRREAGSIYGFFINFSALPGQPGAAETVDTWHHIPHRAFMNDLGINNDLAYI